MSPQIEIPESLFKRLQSHARPFVDTPASVIERWADIIDKQCGVGEVVSASGRSPELNDLRKFDPAQPPNLFHTLVQGEFGGVQFSKWNDLVRVALEKGFERTKSFEALRKITHAQIRNGSCNEGGYRFIPSIGISYQGVDANYAWQHAFRLARFLKIPIKIQIEWRNKDGAAFPGESGLLEWKPA